MQTWRALFYRDRPILWLSRGYSDVYQTKSTIYVCKLFAIFEFCDLILLPSSPLLNISSHENGSGYYRVSAFFFSKIVTDLLPLRFLPNIFFTLIVYFMMGLQNPVLFSKILHVAIYLSSLVRPPTAGGEGVHFLADSNVGEYLCSFHHFFHQCWSQEWRGCQSPGISTSHICSG